jgi:bacillithiol biosynthesis cysteine-adding enzyme BshC
VGKALNLETVVGTPAGAGIVRDYVAGREEAVAFFGAHFENAEAFRAKASEVDRRFDRDLRARAAGALRVPEGGDAARLDRFVEEGGYVGTTGQQPGLLGGPLYSVYKALTAVRLAEALEALLDKPVLPVFWVASEDHDWDEADHTYVVGVDNELHRVRVAPPDPRRHPPLFRVPMGDDAQAATAAFLDALPRTDFSQPHLDFLRETVRPGETLSASYTRIMERLLAPFGVVFTDAADPALKEASGPTLTHELEHAEELEGVLSVTGDALQAAGYGLQVALMPGGVNLFLEGPAGRERLYRSGKGFELHTSGAGRSAAEVRAEADADPSVLSPNVLLRPVVESAVFPTLSYVAGPGEMAYFAQLRGYFEAFGMTMPVIHPRFSVTVVESKIRKVLDKFHQDIEGLRRPFHEIAGDIARDEVPEGVKKALGALRGAIGKGVGDLQKEARAIDATLKGPVQHVRSQSFAALDELEKKIVHALKRENEIALAQLEKARLHLYPESKPQERVMNPFYYVARYGAAFLEHVHERFRLNLG